MNHRSLQCVFGMMLSACGAMPKSGETLMESVQTFNDGVRWERYTVAASRVDATLRAAFLQQAEADSNDVKIAEYDVLGVEGAQGDKATVAIKLKWYRESQGTVQSTQLQQRWVRSGRVWLLREQTWLKGDPATANMELVAVTPAPSVPATP